MATRSALVVLLTLVACDRAPAVKSDPQPVAVVEDVPDEPTTGGSGGLAPPRSRRPDPTIGQAAPVFTLKDTSGAEVSLAALRGKIVVLEWFNPQCPFVNHAHTEGPLHDLPMRWANAGVEWLPINSAGPGMEGWSVTANVDAATSWDLPRPVLLDPTGEVGRLYNARATPTIAVIDANGLLRYLGALDNAPLGKVPSGSVYLDWTDGAINAVFAGRDPNPISTRAWGCAVKYATPVPTGR